VETFYHIKKLIEELDIYPRVGFFFGHNKFSVLILNFILQTRTGTD